MTPKPDLDALAEEVYDKAAIESHTSDLVDGPDDRSIFVRHIRRAFEKLQHSHEAERDAAVREALERASARALQAARLTAVGANCGNGQ